MEYYFLGERELVIAFRLAGVEGSVCVTKNEAQEAFSRLTGHGGAAQVPVEMRPKVLILTEDVSSLIEDEVLEWQKGAKFPLIVELPGLRGHLKDHKSLTDSIREAVGISV